MYNIIVGLIVAVILYVLFRQLKKMKGVRESFESITADLTIKEEIKSESAESPEPNPEVHMDTEGTDAADSVDIADSAAAAAEESKLQRDVRQSVKNEILAKKAITPVISADASESSPSELTAQGSEFMSNTYKKPATKAIEKLKAASEPRCHEDNANFIRKDQIPCWGCTLDF
jgi:hypothetical protein